MALCSRTDTANSRKTYAGREVTKSCAVSNFVSADRIQVDRIGLRLYWIESRSNLVPSVNAPLGLGLEATKYPRIYRRFVIWSSIIS